MFLDTLRAVCDRTHALVTQSAVTDPPPERKPRGQNLGSEIRKPGPGARLRGGLRKPGRPVFYEVTYDTQASGDDAWFFVTYENQASFKIFKVKYETQADLKVFKVKHAEKAGWRNPAHALKGKLG